MGVTHVLRGVDHIANTPRQILLLKALGLSTPTYGHISLIVGSDNQPLSKREGSRQVRELRDVGYLPLAINNYLARLGHYYKNNALMSLDELADQFSLDQLSQSPAQFNQSQLDYWQKYVITDLSETDFWKWAGTIIQSSIPEFCQPLFVSIIKPNVIFPNDIKQWAAICFGELPAWNDEQRTVIKMAGSLYFETAIEANRDLKSNSDKKLIVSALEQHLQLKGKSLHQPLRVALTAQLHGPVLAPLLALMSAEIIDRRLQAAKRLSDENL
jgi:glutamyl/glutaminyl-tRNA synthetase